MNILLERIKSNRIDYKSLVKALLFVSAFMVFSVEINLLSNFFQMVASGNMVPTQNMNDGLGYYFESQSFYHMNLFSVFSYYFQLKIVPFSILLHAGVHGPAYAAFYGSLIYIFGNHVALIPIVNVAMVFIAAGVLWFIFPSKTQKILALLILFSSPIVLKYQATYMVEIIPILFSVVLFSVLVRNNIKLGHVIALLVCASLFRPWFLFLLTGLIVFAKKNSVYKKTAIYLSLMLTSIVILYLYQKYFFGRAYAYNRDRYMHAFSLGQYYSGVTHIVNNAYNQIFIIFRPPIIFNKIDWLAYSSWRTLSPIGFYSIIFSILGASYYGFYNNYIKLKNVALGSITVFFLLILIDIGWHGHLVRHLSFAGFLCIFMLIWEKKYPVVVVWLGLSIFVLPASYTSAIKILQRRSPVLSSGVQAVNKEILKHNCIILQQQYLNYKLPLQNVNGPIKYYYIRGGRHCCLQSFCTCSYVKRIEASCRRRIGWKK